MTRFVTTSKGVGRLAGESVELVDVGFGDLGAAMAAGVTTAEIAQAATLDVAPLTAIELCAPIPRPPKVWIVGKAYHSHRIETDNSPTDEPFITLIAPTAVVGPHDDIRRPQFAPNRVDYEGELGVVIGKTATAIGEDEALDHVAGFTICNDVSARDVQLGQLESQPASVSLGKSFDTFMPSGPALVTLDEFADPHDLHLRTWVDGELRQDAFTSQLIWSVPHLVSFISRCTTLLPGDLISTGTPAGVGHKQGKFLAAGSVVRIEIDGIGAIENRVV